jgi:hypothetical protein
MDDPVESAHVEAGHYVRTRAGRQSPGLLARLHHAHLLEVCAHCRRAWELLPPAEQRAVLERLRLLDERPAEPPPADAAEHLSLDDLAEDEAVLEDLRREQRLVRYSLQKLLSLPPEARCRKVERAGHRFRSRLMAEQLLAECRRRLASDPADADSLASLVPRVVERTPGPAGEPWRHELSALALALRGEVARHAGDPARADRWFAEVHRALATVPVGDPVCRAELAALEAELRLAQGAAGEAARQLEIAALLYRLAGDRDGLARVLRRQADATPPVP